MRILAVRGANLASLAAPFTVDLAAEPLDGAGLFAITGETGAGKSTLLDALCLALYGEYPRIAEGGDQDMPDVEGQTVKARDPRNILRRGTAQGFAEVDFLAGDGRVYRAHWSVNRARGRAGGRLQAAGRRLARLSPEGTEEEVLADRTAVTTRVVELTDLTFEQFRRTVVLPQGEFDAFLRADDKSRADLLEKITGTEIYARLSVAAFEAEKTAREALARAREKRDAIGLLAPEIRADKEARNAAIAAETAEIDARLAVATTAIAAHDRLDRALERSDAAEAAVRAAGLALEEAGEARDRLAAVEAVLKLRPLFDASRKTRRAEAAAVEALAEAETRLERAMPLYDAAKEARDAALDALRAVDERIVLLRPVWDTAAQLDERLAGADRLVAEAEAPFRAAEAEVARCRDECDAVTTRRKDALADLARLVAERERHPELTPVVEQWDAVADRLAERLRARAAAREANLGLGAATRAADAAAEGLDRLEAADTERRDARARAETDLTRARERLTEAREEEARFADDRLADLAVRAGAAAPLLREIEAMRSACDRAAAETAEAAASLERLGRELPPLEAEREALARRLAEGAAADRLAAALDALAPLRADLTEGVPCPLCGATDHPILADPSIADALAALRRERAGLDHRRADLERTIDAARRARAEAEARATAAARTASEAGSRSEAARAALDDADRTARAHAETLGLAWDGFGADPASRFAAAPQAVAERRRPLALRIEAAARARAEIEAIRATIDGLDRAREADAAARRTAADALAEARRRIAVAEETRRAATARIGELDVALEPTLGPLSIAPTDLDRDGAGIAAKLAEAVERRLRLVAETAALSERERRLELDVLRLGDGLAHAERTRIAAETVLADRRAVVAELARERAALLDGEPTASHRGRHEAERAAADTARHDAAEALVGAAAEQDVAMVEIRERRVHLQTAEAETAHAATACDRALAAADLDWETAAALLSTPEPEVEALRARLRDLAEAVSRTTAEAAARRSDLAEAIAAAVDLPPRTVIVAAVEADRAAVEALNRQFGALTEALALDDAARARAAGIETEIARLEADWTVWGAVHGAIGSADGAKFRKFAQGITLDRLAALADRHLETLAPRYRLTRTGGLGLAIVDRDMGDEVRSTRSLSGGERFLASLSLALSLSGLEGRRSFVDTLFIDEGFGSLDAATLDVAIDALEALQSEGRRVGVISHVAAMHERIPVQIRVEKAGAGRSRVRVGGGPG